jgi:hypothetical protein
LGLAAALAVAAALLIPAGAASAAHHFHGSHHRHGLWPYGGAVEAYSLGELVTPVSVASAPLPMTPVVAPKLSLTCHYSRDTVTVPSEDGGTRQITITRC